MKVPFLDIKSINKQFEDSLHSAFQRVIDSGWYIQGKELEVFESEFAEYCTVKHCIGVGNGMDAIHLLLVAYGVGPGDEVIVPAFTWVATANVVVYCGATPVFVDVDRETYNIDPQKIAEKVTRNTKAIIAVHLFGLCADVDINYTG